MAQLPFPLKLIVFFAAILTVAILMVMLQMPMEELISAANEQTSHEYSDRGIGYVETGWQLMPFIGVGLAVLGLLAAAAVRRQLV